MKTCLSSQASHELKHNNLEALDIDEQPATLDNSQYRTKSQVEKFYDKYPGWQYQLQGV